MTKDEALKMAREIAARVLETLGRKIASSHVRKGWDDDLAHVQIALAAIEAGRAAGEAAERERCAEIADKIGFDGWDGKFSPGSKSIAKSTCDRIAWAIRNTGGE